MSTTIPNPATTKWVPVGPGPLPDFRYRGDYAAGNYTDGDIVVYNGVTYLCVQPTNAAPTPWTPPVTSPSYGITLPASPADGQEHILVNSAASPNYQWRFRYNAGSTNANKWEFVGGSPYCVTYDLGQGVSPANTWVAGEPTVVVPRAGLYIIDISCEVVANGGALEQSHIGIALDGAAYTDELTAIGIPATGYGGYSHASRTGYPAQLNAGSSIKHCYYVWVAGTSFRFRSTTVTPMRIS